MKIIDFKNILENFKELAIKAGYEIMKIYSSDFSVYFKEDSSPLTDADKIANDIIVNNLKKNFPNIAFLSEEEKDDITRLDNRYCFVIDPLDGTKEFINKNDEFTVNIALVENGIPIIGVVYVPVKRVMYYALKENGAYKKNLVSGDVKKLHVSDRLSNLILVGSKSHSGEKEKQLIEANKLKIYKTIAAGSSLKGCMVASGEADAYYRFGYTCEWDTAAMHCIALEAGAIIKQMDGTDLVYNRVNTLNDKGFYMVNREENIWL